MPDSGQAPAPEWLPKTIACTMEGKVALLRLSRPGKRNALNIEMIEGLHRFYADPPSGVRAVVLYGEGETFSAGLDLSDVQAHDATEGVFFSRRWHRAFAAMESGEVPTIAVLHGAVIGGGLELAAAAQIRIAEPSTFYALPEGQRGIFVGGGGSVRIPRLIGAARMMDMMLTGRTYGAAEGMSIGLSQYQTGAGEGLGMALEMARRIADNARLSNFAIMQALPRIAEIDPASGYLMESLMSSIAASDGEAKERLTGFLEKRAAKVKHTPKAG